MTTAASRKVTPYSTKRGPTESLRPASKQPTRRRLLQILTVIIFLVAVFGLFAMARKKTDLNNVDTVVAIIGQHYSLPTDESPALATVTDKNKVKASFSVKLQNGDKILIYQKNRKAIVYRPDINRIVDVEPVSIDTPPTGKSTQ